MIRASLLALALLMAARLEAHAQTGVDLVSRSELRVCSDPSDLPFSDQHGDGFENRIVELLGQDLHLPVRYTWYPNSVGFLRNTLLALKCDIVAGTVSGAPMMLTTSPYYRTGYMIVTRSADHVAVRSLADPLLRGKRIGLVAGTPPGDLVVRHGLMAQVRPYELNVDTRIESPPHQMLVDLVAGRIDVALLWGPIAGFYIHRDKLPLDAAFLQPEANAAPEDFAIAMGVRSADAAWRSTLDAALSRHQSEITRILQSYGVPLLDAQNQPLNP